MGEWKTEVYLEIWNLFKMGWSMLSYSREKLDSSIYYLFQMVEKNNPKYT